MASIGGAAAQGLQAGFGMGMQWNEAEDRKKRDQRLETQATEDRGLRLQERAEDRATAAADRTNMLGRQKVADQQHLQLLERQSDADAEQATLAQQQDLQNEGAGLLAESNGDWQKVDPQRAASYRLRVAGNQSARTAISAKRQWPIVEKQRTEANELWARISQGQVDINKVPDDQLVTSLTAMTRRPISDWIPPPNGQSKVQQAGMDMQVGLDSDNEEMMLNAANVIFEPEMQVGVGGPGRDGSKILSKKIVKRVPHPNDPQQFAIVAEVTVRREDGKVATYHAPITENRSADPEDNVKALSIKDALDRVGQLTTLGQTLAQRGIAERLAAGEKAAGDGPKTFLEAYYATGGKKPEPKKVDIGHFEDFGGYKIHYMPDGSQVRIQNTPKPKAAGEGGGSPDAGDREMARIDRGVKQGLYTQEEANEAKKKKLLGTKAGSGGMDSPKAQFEAENKLRDEHQAQSKTFVKVRDAYGKVQTAAKDPTASGDIALIFGYMKILDPDSVVREGEFATAQNAVGIPDRIRNAYNKAIEGTRLNPEQRGDMVNQAKKVYVEQKKGQTKLDETYSGLSKSYGLNAANVVTSYDTQPQEPEPAAAPAPQAPPAAPSAPSSVGSFRAPRGMPVAAAAAPAPAPTGEGSVAVNPKTGEKLVLRGGQWQPLH